MRRPPVLVCAAILLAACTSSTGHGSPSAPPSGRRSESGAIVANPRGNFEARPLVAPGAPVQSGASGVSITGLGFPLPADERAFDGLAPAEKAKLGTALSSVDCTRPGVDTATVRVVCTADAQHTALLTSRPVLTAADLATTQAVPPGGGITQWTIRITLNAAGRSALAAYTTAHHTDQSQTATPVQCDPATVPCADFIAFLAGGVAVSVPVNAAPITNGVIAIAGQFTGASASALARQLAS